MESYIWITGVQIGVRNIICKTQSQTNVCSVPGGREERSPVAKTPDYWSWRREKCSCFAFLTVHSYLCSFERSRHVRAVTTTSCFNLLKFQTMHHGCLFNWLLNCCFTTYFETFCALENIHVYWVLKYWVCKSITSPFQQWSLVLCSKLHSTINFPRDTSLGRQP